MRTFLLLLIALFVPATIFAQTTSDSVTSSLPEAELYENGPERPNITSVDYPSSSNWYAPKNARFSWDLPDGVTAVAIDIATSSGKEPMTPYRPPVSSITIPAEDFVEGNNYIVVQFRNEKSWGSIGERVVRIDRTPPESFSIHIRPIESSDGLVNVSFGTHDVLSGISHYELSINNSPSTRINSGSKEVQLEEGESYTINVQAYDNAGNLQEEEISVVGVVLPVVTPSNIADIAANDPSAILTAVMAALLLLMFGYMVYERQRYVTALEELREETDEIHSQSLRIFSALREEIYEQVTSIAKKSRLSKKEKEVVENLNKALEVSETLIDKEVKDVKKLLD